MRMAGDHRGARTFSDRIRGVRIVRQNEGPLVGTECIESFRYVRVPGAAVVDADDRNLETAGIEANELVGEHACATALEGFDDTLCTGPVIVIAERREDGLRKSRHKGAQ